jgi:hypothetical protein
MGIKIVDPDDEGRRRRDEAMARAEEGADLVWCEHAYAAVANLAVSHTEFCADDVWDLLDAWTIPPPRERRALGPIIMGFVRSGEIVKVRIDSSRRPSRHVGHVTVYRHAGRQVDVGQES